jgi:signal peptidase I
MQEIGIGVMEYITMATAVCGICWLLARRRAQIHIHSRRKKPLWVTWGAEMFGILLLVLTGRVALADWPNVPSGSMEPTVRVGDYLLVDKLVYGPRLPFTNTAIVMGHPQRGDVVVFRYPRDVSVFYVKRTIGVPGDVVSYNHGVVRVNDEPFAASLDRKFPDVRPEDRGQIFVRETESGREHEIKLDEMRPGALVPPQAWLEDSHGACKVASSQQWQCTVPAGKYLMMGDNRDNSADSRVWGFLDQREIYGKAVRVLVNFSDLKRAFIPL